MKPISIKFSHYYVKFPPDYQESKLVDVENVNLEDLDPDFLEHDTAIVGGGHYKLPKRGKYMILWLETESGKRWQTIRRWQQRKEDYYRSLIGEWVRAVVEEVPAPKCKVAPVEEEKKIQRILK